MNYPRATSPDPFGLSLARTFFDQATNKAAAKLNQGQAAPRRAACRDWRGSHWMAGLSDYLVVAMEGCPPLLGVWHLVEQSFRRSLHEYHKVP